MAVIDLIASGDEVLELFQFRAFFFLNSCFFFSKTDIVIFES